MPWLTRVVVGAQPPSRSSFSRLESHSPTVCMTTTRLHCGGYYSEEEEEEGGRAGTSTMNCVMRGKKALPPSSNVQTSSKVV
jgi:hypothetical protein